MRANFRDYLEICVETRVQKRVGHCEKSDPLSSMLISVIMTDISAKSEHVGYPSDSDPSLFVGVRPQVGQLVH